MLTMALSGKDSLVSDDYYKEGKAINNTFEKKAIAEELGLSAQLEIRPDSLLLEFDGNLPADGTALKMNFFHRTLEEKDFIVLLTKNSLDQYVGYHELDPQGRWRVTLSDFDETWKIQRLISLPHAGKIRFEP